MVVTQHQSGFLRCFPNALKLFPQTGATSQQIRFYIIPFKLLCPVIPSAGSHILGATFYRQPAEYASGKTICFIYFLNYVQTPFNQRLNRFLYYFAAATFFSR